MTTGFDPSQDCRYRANMTGLDCQPYAPGSIANLSRAQLVEIAAATPAVQDGRIYIERIDAQFQALLNGSRGHPEFGNGIRYALEQGWLWMHESGTYVKLLPTGRPCFRRPPESFAGGADLSVPGRRSGRALCRHGQEGCLEIHRCHPPAVFTNVSA